MFIDFEKAYDMVWRKGVLYKLDKLGFDGNIFNWVNAFFQDRSLQVQVGNSLSQSFVFQNGLPQGSVISPILFLIAINDLKPQGVKYSLFADDAALWKCGKNVDYLESTMQSALDYIQEWCDSWGFKISIIKSNFVFFHRGKEKRITLEINNHPLQMVKKVTFLGMVFDHRFTWRDHIDYLINKCQKRINVLKLLTGSKWGADKSTMVILYKTLIRSVLDYGCVVYHSASDTVLQKLDVIQSQSLRLCSGALYCTPVNALEVDCGVPPLELRRKYLALKLYIKYKYAINNPAQECFEECYQLYYGKYNDHFKPLRCKIDNYAISLPEAYKEFITDTIPTWEYDNLIIDTGLHSKFSKKHDNPHLMKSLSLEGMEQWSSYLHIYTDGSKCNDNTAFAFHVPSLKYEKKIKLPNNTSVFMAEMIAILESLNFLLHKPPLGCVIFSDSLSAIQSIEMGTDTSSINQEINYCIYQLWCQGVPIVLSWIPSHVDIRGNEVADKLAKEALFCERIDYPLLRNVSDLNIHIENELISEWQTRWDSDTKGRFYHKLQPKVSFEVKYSDPFKAKQTTITRLRFGKCLLGNVLCMIGKRNNDLCEFCGVKEDVAHFLLQCREFHDALVELNDSLLNEDIIPSVESILGNPKAFNYVWNYILKTQKSL